MIKEVELKDWKNHKRLRLAFAPGLNFIIGPNGIGKTAILQAINFAICSTWERAEKGKYIRKGCSQSEVLVKFAVSDRDFTLRNLVDTERTQTTLEEDGLGRSFKDSLAYEKLQSLFQLPTLARERLLHVKEGEVHFLCFPSTQLTMENQEFARHMRSLLGLEQIDSVIDVIGEIQRRAREEVHLIEQQLGDALNREKLSTVEKRIKDNELSLEEIAIRKNKALTARDSAQERVWKIQKEVSNLSDAMTEASQLLEVAQQFFGGKPLFTDLKQYLEENILKLRKDYEDLQKKQVNLYAKADVLRGRREIYSDLLSFLKSSAGDKEAVTKCPLCHQPLTQERYERIVEEIGSQLREIGDELSKCSLEMQQITATRKQSEGRLKQADGLLHTIIDLEERVGPIGEVQKKLTEAEKKKQVAEQKIAGLFKEFDKHDTEYKKKIELIQRDKELLKRPVKEKLELKLRNTLRHGLLAETIVGSLKSVAQRQQQVINERVIKRLNESLHGFALPGKGSVSLDESMIPYVVSDGERYDFDMLSAGERTSIYVITRVLLNRTVSRVNFIMIDEPFEHLDSVNRRYLRDFLRQAANSSFLSQVIVTTYEETLTRTFLEGAKANLHYIS